MQTKTACLERGKPTYTATEILLLENRLHIEGNIEDFKRTDIWACGMVLFLIWEEM